MDADAERLRDALTAEHLLAYARSIDPHAEPISFQPDWWDGSANAGCLLVQIPGGRRRVVSTGAGEPMLLPAGPGRARRTLTARRRASSAPLPAGSASPSQHVALTTAVVPTPRLTGEAKRRGLDPAPTLTLPEPPPIPHRRRTVIQTGDYMVCRYADCGGLLPVDGEPSTSGCPSCGRH